MKHFAKLLHTLARPWHSTHVVARSPDRATGPTEGLLFRTSPCPPWHGRETVPQRGFVDFVSFVVHFLVIQIHARSLLTTSPCTSVNRYCLPWNLCVSFV